MKVTKSQVEKRLKQAIDAHQLSPNMVILWKEIIKRMQARHWRRQDWGMLMNDLEEDIRKVNG